MREEESKLEKFIDYNTGFLIKSKIGYPLIGMASGEFQKKVAEKYGVGKWRFNFSHMAFCLILSSIPVIASHMAKNYTGRNLWTDIAQYGSLTNLAKSGILNTIRAGAMAYRRDPVGDFVIEGFSKVFKEASHLMYR